MSLHTRAINWAITRDILHPNGTPNQGTREGQLAKVLEEINEARNAIAMVNTNRLIHRNIPHREKEAATELGGVQVTLILLAAMHGTSIPHCVRAATSATLPKTYLDRPKHWVSVGYWAQMLELHQNPATIGTLWLCVLNCARTQLGVAPERCLEMAIVKNEQR